METARSKVTPLRRENDVEFRAPPANTDAEQQLLGAILTNNAAYHRVAAMTRSVGWPSLARQRRRAA